MRDPDPGWKKFWSGKGKSQILDPKSGKTSRIYNIARNAIYWRRLIKFYILICHLCSGAVRAGIYKLIDNHNRVCSASPSPSYSPSPYNCPSLILGSAPMGGFSHWAYKRWGDGERSRRMAKNKCMNVIERMYVCCKKIKNKQKEWHPTTKPLIASRQDNWLINKKTTKNPSLWKKILNPVTQRSPGQIESTWLTLC